MSPEIVVSVLVGIGFLAVIVFIAINWKKPKFPEGKRIEYQWNSYKVHLILDGVRQFGYEISAEQLAKACTAAAFSVNCMWEKSLCEKKGNVREIVVLFQSADKFLYMGTKAPGVQAYLDTCSYKIGGGYLPMAVIRSEHIQRTFEKGEPVIHELCHELLGEHTIDRHGHNETEVWASFGKDTIQHSAQMVFASTIKKAVDAT